MKKIRKPLWAVYRRLRRRLLRIPEPGQVDFGQLRRSEPFGRFFGEDRGLALDRYYIESFLDRNRGDIRGHALEIGEDRYTRRFGGDRVSHSDVLHVSEGNPAATIVADLADAPHIDSERFDVLIVTQTLHLVYDPGSALRTLHRILRPGGVLLLTVPGITQVPRGTLWAHTWYWAFAPLGIERMLAETFGTGAASVESHGSVLSAAAMLYGLAAEDLSREELDVQDPDYPVIITARAVRGAH